MASFETLRKMANAQGGIRQVNMGRTQEGAGSVSVRLSSGVTLRAEASSWEDLKRKVMRWKRAQGVPMCLNGSPSGFVDRKRS